MIRGTLTVLAIAFATMFLGCHKDFNSQPDYVGTWTNGAGTTVTFNANNTYSLSVQSALVSSGTCKAKNNILSLVGTAGFCHDSLPAAYAYNYTVTTTNGTFIRNLTLTTSSDSCSARVAALPGNYIIPAK